MTSMWFASTMGDMSEAIDRAFRASSQAINAEQYRMLAPDEAWSSFSQAARALFS